MKDSQTSPRFTVFTATYNRAHTLHRVHDSLKAQTLRDFEWLVVDDGSTDETPALFERWAAENAFPIRLVRQANGGKHTAFNHGVRLARGELFLTFDSDDGCPPHTLERFLAAWQSIPAAERAGFSGVTALCADEHGRPVGGPLGAPVIDGRPFEVMSRLRREGEMWGFHRTEVLRRFPFPEFAGERWVPEGLVWNRIGREYRIRFIDEVLRTYFDSADGLSAAGARLRRANPQATLLHYTEALDLPGVRWRDRWRSGANLVRFAVASRRWAALGEGWRRARATFLLAMPAGLLLAFRDG
jgi:glycosyltransferase involved in cell wall biosynthesis